MLRSAIAILPLICVSMAAGSQSVSDSAQQPPAAESGVELESVTVEARRRRERIDRQVSEFVYTIAGSGRVESLARWKVPVCAVAVGLAAAEAEFVRKRIAEIAAEADVPLGRPGCGPNFVVIVAPEPEKLLREWWSEEHRLFNRDRGVGGVERFIESEQPVRAWHNACNAPPGISAHAFSAGEHCGQGVTGSRLVWAAVRAIYSAIVAVDFTRIEGLTFGQVADYVAMVGLAQIRSSPELGEVPTILSLFSANGAGRPKGLTDWDQSFLEAVYDTTDGNVTEISQIKLRMSDRLAR
jgi:hypothetical protein